MLKNPNEDGCNNHHIANPQELLDFIAEENITEIRNLYPGLKNVTIYEPVCYIDGPAVYFGTIRVFLGKSTIDQLQIRKGNTLIITHAEVTPGRIGGLEIHLTDKSHLMNEDYGVISDYDDEDEKIMEKLRFEASRDIDGQADDEYDSDGDSSGEEDEDDD